MGASGLLIAGGAINAGTALANTVTREYSPQGSDEFDGFYYLSGDHHIHSRYSPDAKYGPRFAREDWSDTGPLE